MHENSGSSSLSFSELNCEQVRSGMIPINKTASLNEYPDPTQKIVNHSQREAQIDNVSKMYEKHFLRELVKAMRSTVTPSEWTQPGMAESIYRQNLDHEYVEQWGNEGGIGLADVIYDQIVFQYGKTGQKNSETRQKIEKSENREQSDNNESSEKSLSHLKGGRL